MLTNSISRVSTFAPPEDSRAHMKVVTLSCVVMSKKGIYTLPNKICASVHPNHTGMLNDALSLLYSHIKGTPLVVAYHKQVVSLLAQHGDYERFVLSTYYLF